MFNLKASNGQVVGSSRIYKTASERDQGISMTKSDAPGAETDDLT
ncbi:MAG: YegP family protein [Candidatus Sedimenticola sp. 6PFRAG5]